MLAGTHPFTRFPALAQGKMEAEMTRRAASRAEDAPAERTTLLEATGGIGARAAVLAADDSQQLIGRCSTKSTSAKRAPRHGVILVRRRPPRRVRREFEDGRFSPLARTGASAVSGPGAPLDEAQGASKETAMLDAELAASFADDRPTMALQQGGRRDHRAAPARPPLTPSPPQPAPSPRTCRTRWT